MISRASFKLTNVFVEAFVSQPAVKGFDESILDWLAGLDVAAILTLLICFSGVAKAPPASSLVRLTGSYGPTRQQITGAEFLKYLYGIGPSFSGLGYSIADSWKGDVPVNLNARDSLQRAIFLNTCYVICR